MIIIKYVTCITVHGIIPRRNVYPLYTKIRSVHISICFLARTSTVEYNNLFDSTPVHDNILMSLVGGE